MQTVYPAYYPHFRCIAERCKHNCCVGWEIDIDERTLQAYECTKGAIGDKLRASISKEGTPHFVLGCGERCPFLNERNLCELILTLGEDSLCDICTRHPRFYNSYSDRTEIGVGLSCEEAGRLILSNRKPVGLITDGGAPFVSDGEEVLLAVRDRVTGTWQNRTLSIDARADAVAAFCAMDASAFHLGTWCELLLGLERLDARWTKLVGDLQACHEGLDMDAFQAYMGERMTEYEQFAVYLIYRYAANAEDAEDLAARIAFSVLGYRILCALGAMLYAQTGSFSFEDQVELARLFSSEIEYSEQNIQDVLTRLGE